jgi:uncharacterized membrane protein
MDNKLVFGLTYATALGSGLMAGLFFTFSVFMMRSLDRLPPSQGIAAMQSINTTIVTPLFLLVFVGTTVACAVLGGVAAFAVDGPARVWLIVGCLLYLVGCFLLTGGFPHPPERQAGRLRSDHRGGRPLLGDLRPGVDAREPRADPVLHRCARFAGHGHPRRLSPAGR